MLDGVILIIYFYTIGFIDIEWVIFQEVVELDLNIEFIENYILNYIQNFFDYFFYKFLFIFQRCIIYSQRIYLCKFVV